MVSWAQEGTFPNSDSCNPRLENYTIFYSRSLFPQHRNHWMLIKDHTVRDLVLQASEKHSALSDEMLQDDFQQWWTLKLLSCFPHSRCRLAIQNAYCAIKNTSVFCIKRKVPDKLVQSKKSPPTHWIRHLGFVFAKVLLSILLLVHDQLQPHWTWKLSPIRVLVSIIVVWLRRCKIEMNSRLLRGNTTSRREHSLRSSYHRRYREGEK